MRAPHAWDVGRVGRVELGSDERGFGPSVAIGRGQPLEIDGNRGSGRRRWLVTI